MDLRVHHSNSSRVMCCGLYGVAREYPFTYQPNWDFFFSIPCFGGILCNYTKKALSLTILYKSNIKIFFASPQILVPVNPSKLKRGQAVDRQKQPERRMPKQVTEKPAPGNQPRTEKPAGFPDPDIVDFPAIVKSAKSGGSSCFTTLPCAVIRSLLLLFHLLASLRA